MLCSVHHRHQQRFAAACTSNCASAVTGLPGLRRKASSACLKTTNGRIVQELGPINLPLSIFGFV
jgi:hypothetical protein